MRKPITASFSKPLARLCQLALVTVSAITLHAQAKEKIIIDADVGIDDAMAILLASQSPELEVVGITTGFGNASIEDSTRNALYLLDRTGQDIPVAEGAHEPLIVPPIPPVAYVHGNNGMGDVPVSEPSRERLSSLSAAEFILEQSRRYPGELTLVPIGRSTNIALALKLDRTLPQRIKRVVLMGGAFETKGNMTPVAGANVFGDPHAADIVFQADWDVTAIGSDVTRKVMIDAEDLAELAKRNPVAGGWVRDMTQFYLDFHRSVGVEGGFYIHDPTALMYLIKPSLFTTKRAAIRVATQGLAIGQTIASSRLKTQSDVWQVNKFNAYAAQVDSEGARELLLSRLAKVAFVR